MNEFDIIADYFRILTMGRAECAGLQDDAAVLTIPPGRELVVSTDTLNAGTHFLKNEAPENIARKALRVNLSDLAASGADPLCYQLSMAYPQKPQAEWLKAFTGALLEDQTIFGIFCSGGDTTSIHGGVLSVSMTVLGTVPAGKAVRRGGARAGDMIVLTGSVGDAALGLHAVWNGREAAYPKAVARHRLPLPRVVAAEAVRENTHAAIDISDGLLADLGHICAASHLAAEVRLAGEGGGPGTASHPALALSEEVRMALLSAEMKMEDVLSGGDDYELVLAVAPDRLAPLLAGLEKLAIPAQVIGRFTAGAPGVKVLDAAGAALSLKAHGWQHF